MRALIVEDNEDMRELVSLTMQLSGVEVAGEAATGGAGVRGWREQQPDFVVLDYVLPDDNGLNVAEQLLREDPAARIVLFSAHLDDATLARAARLGVGAVTKDRLTDLVMLATGAVAA